MPIDHEFGGQHSELKLSVVERYLKAYSHALRNKFDVWYIDAFAGTGSRTVRTEARDGDLFDAPVLENVEQRRGSARVAIDIRPPFSRLVFMESRPSYCAALQQLVAAHPDRDITVVEGDANSAIQSAISWDGWKTTRAVMFLDPYGMQVEWRTLEAIAATRAVDVWFLFPLSGLYRQATRKITDIDENKRASLTRMFGSDAWEAELYSDGGQADMFGGDSRRRLADVKGL
jgi:three-Cys-motif partner protein